jgi:hypothetical protein
MSTHLNSVGLGGRNYNLNNEEAREAFGDAALAAIDGVGIWDAANLTLDVNGTTYHLQDSAEFDAFMADVNDGSLDGHVNERDQPPDVMYKMNNGQGANQADKHKAPLNGGSADYNGKNGAYEGNNGGLPADPCGRPQAQPPPPPPPPPASRPPTGFWTWVDSIVVRCSASEGDGMQGYLQDGERRAKPSGKDPEAWQKWVSKARYADIQKALLNGEIPPEVLKDEAFKLAMNMRMQSHNELVQFLTTFLDATHQTKKQIRIEV